MSLEDQLLLYVVDENLKDETLHKFDRNFSANLDWSLLIGRAIHNRVIPMLNRTFRTLLNKGLGNNIPGDVIRKVQELDYSFIGHSILFHEEAKKIFNLMNVNHIRFVPIKGILLSNIIYSDRSKRYFTDIDILFPNFEERKRAETLISKLGYRFLSADACATTFRRRMSNVVLNCDMHHAISLFDFFVYPKISYDVWKNSTYGNIYGQNTKIISPEQMLIFLLINSIRNRGLYLIDLCDILNILTRYQTLDWNLVLQKLQTFLCLVKIPILVIEKLSEELSHDQIIPEKILTLLNDSGRKKVLNNIREIDFFKNFSYPIFYRDFCNTCLERDNCSLYGYFSFFLESNLPLKNYFRRFLFDYRIISTTIMNEVGIKYALRCFYQECAGISYLFLRKFGVNILPNQLLSPIYHFERKELPKTKRALIIERKTTTSLNK
jgi:hypothetical protein